MIGFMMAEDDLGPVFVHRPHAPAAFVQDGLRVEPEEVGLPVLPCKRLAVLEGAPKLLFGMVMADLAFGFSNIPKDVPLSFGRQSTPEGGEVPLRHILKEGFRSI